MRHSDSASGLSIPGSLPDSTPSCIRFRSSKQIFLLREFSARLSVSAVKKPQLFLSFIRACIGARLIEISARLEPTAETQSSLRKRREEGETFRQVDMAHRERLL